MLNVHYAVGLILFVTALAAIVVPQARRVVVYVLLLQIVLGIATWWTTKLVPPAPHWILALLAGGIWPMANAFERKGRPKGRSNCHLPRDACVRPLVSFRRR